MDNQELRKAGLKVTLPRVKILQQLESADGQHMSVEDIYRALLESGEDVALPTIYRALEKFEQAGLVESHKFEDGPAVYELAPDEHHDHMFCVDTNEVIEFVDPEIEKRQKMIAEKHGYELVDHTLVLYVRPKKKN